MAEDNQDTFLSPVQRDALVAGAAMFIDEVFEDFVSVCNGEALERLLRVVRVSAKAVPAPL